MLTQQQYDLIVIGAGAAGIIAAITAARENKNVLLLEKLPQIATKLKATGGGRCNLTNTLPNEEFMARFGRDGRFMQDALKEFDYKKLILFFKEIGVDTHAPDGFHIFPTSHKSSTIIESLQKELKRLFVTLKCNQKAQRILSLSNSVSGVKTESETFFAKNIIVATGGVSYPSLGADDSGYILSNELGHTITDLFAGMTPLKTKEKWVQNCRADTIAKTTLRINLKKYKKLSATGDLIFTKNGIRGPVVLDFSREITPLLKKYKEVPLLLNLTKGMNAEEIKKHFKKELQNKNIQTVSEVLQTILPKSVANELCKLAEIKPDERYKKTEGKKREKLLSLLAWTPLTIIGENDFKMAMITRGGIKLKEIDPKTMQSRYINGLYFCGEIVNLDGPCGGYNLQWSFASGYLAGKLKKTNFQNL